MFFSKDLYTYSVGKVINMFNSSFMGPEMAGAIGRTTTPIWSETTTDSDPARVDVTDPARTVWLQGPSYWRVILRFWGSFGKFMTHTPQGSH